tara:strand:- start:329 stop:574 length:246 start_codon:yes stop_codon:yes gene_type:complete
MTNSKKIIDKIAKLLEQGMITSKDLGDELKNVLNFKKDEIAQKLNFVSKDEFEIQKLRLNKIEKKLNEIIKNNRSKKVKKS